MEAINHIEITIPISQVKESIQSILSSIFFQRILDTLEPETKEIQDLHIACSTSTSVELEIKERINEFERKYLKDDTGYDKGEIALIFTQKKSRKGWFGITEEIVPWEAHFITIHFLPSSSQQTLSTKTIMTDALVQIISFCAERGGCVPIAGTGEGDKLSHQIIISPPPPSDLFAPSPPNSNPNPIPSRSDSTTIDPRSRRNDSPSRHTQRDGKDGKEGTMGYLEQAKDVLRATGARAGVVAGWTTSTGGRGGRG